MQEAKHHGVHSELADQERRRKAIENLAWGILAGAITALLLAIAFYFFTIAK